MARQRRTPDRLPGTSAPGSPTTASPATAPPGTARASTRPPSSEGEGRRRFVVRAWVLLGGAAIGELLWITGSFLRPKRRDAAAMSLFVAGPLGRFEPGSVTAFPSGRFYLVRLKDGGFMALHRECTHLGCTVPWDASQQRFACPCHASVFDITGGVLSPPAPRPLDFYPVRIENGVVKVDTRRRLRRDAFDPSQVTLA